MKETLKQLQDKVGSLSTPSKMPGYGYSTSADDCITGSKLANVKGSICSICYARKGRYVFPNVQNAMKKRLESLERLDWIDTMVQLISRKEKSGFFRWHDSGDLQGVWHLEKIAEVARRLPSIKFWLPTREYKIVSDWIKFCTKPRNLTIRLSAFMIDGPAPVAVAKRLGLTTSGAKKTGFSCPSSQQGNQCGDCRACWDEAVTNVDYKPH
tara:strand:+ start:1328 stop:1960 length:633 start_codon:yes stop_codon:yes gene_type:complete